METILDERGGDTGVRSLAGLHALGSHPLTLDLACELAGDAGGGSGGSGGGKEEVRYAVETPGEWGIVPPLCEHVCGGGWGC